MCDYIYSLYFEYKEYIEYKAYFSICEKYLFFIRRGIQKYPLIVIDQIFDLIDEVINQKIDDERSLDTIVENLKSLINNYLFDFVNTISAKRTNI